ncbi:hypothetical protein Ddye_020805 [Dipteronia dyeriana]|uniref:Uncharacterized protein n=1 Tax=Dipteronia dyeriana TaxID=168575 RepID=A0AAD9U1H1_9ROSI|nr:hypothetical protein Ddye_020805 [Dipteronia dyeriana]
MKRLVTLDLSKNWLAGPIPSAVSHLTNLKSLCLIGKQIIGSIPEEIGKLKNLENLDGKTWKVYILTNLRRQPKPQLCSDLLDVQYFDLPFRFVQPKPKPHFLNIRFALVHLV